MASPPRYEIAHHRSGSPRQRITAPIPDRSSNPVKHHRPTGSFFGMPTEAHFSTTRAENQTNAPAWVTDQTGRIISCWRPPTKLRLAHENECPWLAHGPFPSRSVAGSFFSDGGVARKVCARRRRRGQGSESRRWRGGEN